MATINQITRLAMDWEAIAKEPVEMEQICATIYGFCSELGTLRLLKKYRYAAAECGYSVNLKKFYFRIEFNS